MTLLWLDLETTGLDPERDALLEVAAVVTDDAFVQVAPPFHAVVDSALSRAVSSLPQVVADMHVASGLWFESIRVGRDLADAGAALAGYVKAHAEGAQLAGSTISFDRSFLRRQLPAVDALLHYRNLDVSSVGEVVRRVWPAVYEARPRPDEGAKHRALADVAYSLELCRYYVAALGGQAPAPAAVSDATVAEVGRARTEERERFAQVLDEARAAVYGTFEVDVEPDAPRVRVAETHARRAIEQVFAEVRCRL